MARMKHITKKRTVREDNKRLPRVGPPMSGKVPQNQFLAKSSVEGRPIPSGMKPMKRPHQFRPGMKALMEIRCFQKSTDLLIPKRLFYRLVKEVLQVERSWLKTQAAAVMGLHEASMAYLIWLLEDSYICAIYKKE